MGFLKWLKNKLSKKENEMAKAKKESVRFAVLDGVKPNRVGPGKLFNLKSPLTLNIPAGATMKVDLGLSCNYPLHIIQARSMLQRSLLLPDGIWAAVDADTPLVLRIENKSKETALVERGDNLARAFVLDNNDLEVEA
jgi:hypothetical protein